MSQASTKGSSVSVVGLGKLGSCMAASMAHKGMFVVGVDKNQSFVDLINEGKPPVVEPRLGETIAANRSRLRATTDMRSAIFESEITFVIVPTPSDESGGFSLAYVSEAMREIARALREKGAYHLVVLTSTVLPGASLGTVVPLLEKESGKVCGKDFGFCYNPEFIALGSVIQDLLNPDFLLIGQGDDRAGAMLEAWYAAYCDNKPAVARMNVVNAELTKISVNTYVTTKIAFANMLAGICERIPGGDIDTVSAALGLDRRIGPKYLKGALGYGGPCFPRDNRALSHVAKQVGAIAPIAEATDRANRELVVAQADWVLQSLRPGNVVAVLGLAYKPDTAVLEESAGLAVVRHLIEGGVPVVVYDPLALSAARAVLGESVRYAASIAECLGQADAVVVANPCREFASLGPDDFPRRAHPIKLFDCWRLLRGKVEAASWIDYVPLGVGLPGRARS